MPSKSKRAASRQAQLSGRRRRRGGRPRAQATAATTTAARPPEVRRQSSASTPTAERLAGTSQRQQAVTPATAPTRRRTSRPRAPVEPLQMYPYLGSELRRIGALSGLVAITLAVLTVVLR